MSTFFFGLNMDGINTQQTKDIQFKLLLVPVGKVDQSNMFHCTFCYQNYPSHDEKLNS
jgi:hypothetical protein